MLFLTCDHEFCFFFHHNISLYETESQGIRYQLLTNLTTNVDNVGNNKFGAGNVGHETRYLPADQCQDECIDAGIRDQW